MRPLQFCIGPTIRIGRESWCLPYAGFFCLFLYSVSLQCYIFKEEKFGFYNNISYNKIKGIYL